MLHIAPEKCFELIFKEKFGSGYLSADLYGKAMVKMDICNIQYPDKSFDIIYCSHVLEHVIEDRKAIREFFRVLKTSGWAILNVPITNGKKTFEDANITDPKERLKVFGQEDHVRRYGLDYFERIRDVGFNVKIIKSSDFLNRDEITKMIGENKNEEIYYCTK